MKKKLLLVDDDKDFIGAIAHMLEAEGYDTVLAHNVNDGMQALFNENPDLLILDVNMETEFAGFELSRKVRGNGEYEDIPIIMLTAIDTVNATEQLIDFYRAEGEKSGFDQSRVLKMHGEDDVVVDYNYKGESPYYLPLDGFVSKPVEIKDLVKEIDRFI